LPFFVCHVAVFPKKKKNLFIFFQQNLTDKQYYIIDKQ